jgi:hypothetical protein
MNKCDELERNIVNPRISIPSLMENGLFRLGSLIEGNLFEKGYLL